MKKETIQKLTIDFDNIVNKQEDTEFWFARELMLLLGYDRWENFANVIEKATISCKNAGQPCLCQVFSPNSSKIKA